MRIHLRLPLSEIAALLQRTFPEVLFAGTQEGVEVVVRQMRSPKVAGWDPHTLVVHVPVRVSLKLPDASVPGLLSMIPGVRSDEFELELNIRLLVGFNTLPEWKVQTHTRAHYDWARKPTVGVTIFDFDVSKVAEPLINRQLSEVCTQIDAYLNDELKLNQILYDAWEMLREPLLLDADTQTWVCIRPQGQLTGTPVEATNDALHLHLEASGAIFAGMDVNKEVPVLAPLMPLKLVAALPAAVPVVWHFRTHAGALAKLAAAQGHPRYAAWLQQRRAIRALQWPLMAPVRAWLHQQAKPLLADTEAWLKDQLREIALPPYLVLHIAAKEIDYQPFVLGDEAVSLAGTAAGSVGMEIALR